MGLDGIGWDWDLVIGEVSVCCTDVGVEKVTCYGCFHLFYVYLYYLHDIFILLSIIFMLDMMPAEINS